MLKVLNETIIKDVDETEKINLRPIITTLEQFKRKANFRYNSSPDPQNVPSRKDSQGPAMFPKSLLPRSDTEKLLEQSRGIFEFDPVELARQLCLLDFEIYSVIGRSELLNQNWEKPDRAKLSPNITEMIKNTNSVR
jgi:hypothetical protein